MGVVTYEEYIKRKKKKDEENKLNGVITLDDYAEEHGLDFSSSIAPITTKKDDDLLDFFQKGAFEDGYQFGDATKTVLGTVGDAGLNILQGASSLVEGLKDAGQYGVAGISDLLGADEFAEDVRRDAKRNSTKEIFGGATDFVNQYSVLGNTSDAIMQGLGQVGTIILTGGLGATAGLGTLGTTALTTGVMAVSSTGSGMSEAYQGGATDEEATVYGLSKGVIDAGSELLFGGLGKTVKAIGLSKGLSSLDDVFAQKLSSKISNQVAKNFVEFGVKSSAEGFEEVLAGVGTAVAKNLTYMDDKELSEILKDENLLEQFIVGTVTSGMIQSGYIPATESGSLKEANEKGRDFITDLTENETKVVEAEVENRIKAKETDGKKLTNKEKSAIRDEVMNDLDKGYINLDTIESVLGGETYESYKSLTDKEEWLRKDIALLESDPRPTAQARLENARKELSEIENNSAKAELKDKLSLEVQELTKSERLSESYNEKARRSQKFEADLTKYDAKVQETIKKATESGILNNTNRTHEFVDMIAKLSADKGVSFDFTNNENLKKSGFALDGKTVNGLVKDNDIILNIESSKALNTVVGHEITHVLEGTELYTELQNAVKEYATTKGEYDARLQEITKLYKGVKNANIDNELTADLVGEYLFTDSDFVNNLSTTKPNVFKKIYDEIKYLYKVATAGSKEARQLEKVKKAFDKAYKESSSKTTEKTEKTDAKYSLSEGNNVRTLTEEDYDKLKSFFGTTTNYDVAGYMLPDGTMLDFSGKHWGNPVATSRDVDHRDVWDVWENTDADGTDEMVNMISNGNIRLMPESGGINLAINPSESQKKALERYINHFKGEIVVDIDRIGGDTEKSFAYDKGTTADAIFKDIERYFNGGNVSDLMRFHTNYSLSSEKQDIAPVGDYHVYGKDIALDSNIAPVKSDSKTSEQTSKNKTIEQQILDNLDMLNKMETIAETKVDANVNMQNKADIVKLALEKLGSVLRVNREGYGEIVFGKKQIKQSMSYMSIEDMETYVHTLMPEVLKKGVEIEARNNHKGREYGTKTFAGPVEVNGKRGIMAVVVKETTKNTYKVHRLRTPDGKVFKFEQNENEAGLPHDGGVTANSSLATSTSSASEIIVPQNGKNAIEDNEYAPITDASGIDAQQSDRLYSLDESQMPDEAEAPYYEPEDVNVEDPFMERDIKDVGKRNVNAYMYDNPEVKPYFQEEAQNMLWELKNSVKGEKSFNDQLYYDTNGEEGWFGTKRETSDDIAYLLDNFKYTYADIEKGLNAIIEDHGAENNAISKRIEFAINDRLKDGYTDFMSGQEVPSNQDYVNLLMDKQINTYSDEAYNQYLESLAQEYASQDIAPVRQQYEAIEPAPQNLDAQEQEWSNNKMARVKDPNTVKPHNVDAKMRSWVETSTESEVVNREILPDDLDLSKIVYEPIPNKVTLSKANAKLDTLGYEESLSYFNNQLAGKKASLEDIALGERLLQEAMQKGDTVTAGELIQNIAILGTELGQKVQALSIIQRLTPEGQLKMLHKTIKRGKVKGDKAFEGVELTQEMIDHILKTYKADGSFDQNELNNAVEDVKKKIAKSMKVTTIDKVNAWRYLAMLGNPKTHIRNLVSNVAMKGTLGVKNAVARTIEGIAPIEERTKTWKRATDEVNAFAEATTLEMKDVISEDTKYSEEASIKSKRDMFKNQILNKVYNFNNDLMAKEDWWFSKPAYKNALSEFLTANGIKTSKDIENNPKIVEKAKQYALEQSQIATFRQYSWLASKIREVESKNTATEIAVGSILPFKKTPVNIAKAGLSYSPLGFAKALTYDLYQMKQGKMQASQVVDNVAKGVTGSALVYVGYMLAMSGLLSGGGDDDKEGKYDYQLGEQAYSINFGGNSYSLSWLSPVAMPLFVGANAYEQLIEGEEWNGDVVMETLAQTLDPLSEMSFLSSLDSVLSSYDSGVEKFAGIGETMIQSYATQFIPTLSSQVASTLDEKKRTTKVAGDSDFKIVDETINKLIYKIPLLRETLEPSTDIWGNEVKQSENMIERALENFIAPYSRKESIATEIDAEIKDLYAQTGDNGIIPNVPYNYVNYDGEKYKMSAKEYTDFKKTYGQTANDLLEDLFRTTTYQNSTSEDRAEMVNKVYDYARDEAKKDYLSKEGVNYTNATQDGVEYYKENHIKGAIENDMALDEFDMFAKSPEKYYITKAVGGYDTYKTYTSELNNITADKDKNGKTISGSRKKKVESYLDNLSGIDYGAKIILFKTEYPADDTYNKDIVNYLNNREDISYSEVVNILKGLGFTVKPDGTVRW